MQENFVRKGRERREEEQKVLIAVLATRRLEFLPEALFASFADKMALDLAQGERGKKSETVREGREGRKEEQKRNWKNGSRITASRRPG